MTMMESLNTSRKEISLSKGNFTNLEYVELLQSRPHARTLETFQPQNAQEVRKHHEAEADPVYSPAVYLGACAHTDRISCVPVLL